VTVLVKGIQTRHLPLDERVGAIASLRHQNHLFDDLPSAVGRGVGRRACAEPHPARTPETP
jgi:SulP family sulfate permease